MKCNLDVAKLIFLSKVLRDGPKVYLEVWFGKILYAANQLERNTIIVSSTWLNIQHVKKSTIYRCLDTWVYNRSFRPETSYFKSPIATEHYPLLFQLYQADRLQLRFTAINSFES